MDRFADCGTQTDAVVVLSLTQAAVLGLVSENEFFGASVTPAGFFPSFSSDLGDTAVVEPLQPESKHLQDNESQGQAELPEEEGGLEAEAPFGKHARRRKRPPVRLVPKVKHEKGEVEQEEVAYEGQEDQLTSRSTGLEEEQSCDLTVQSSATKMIDLNTFSRKPRRLRQLRRHTQPEPSLGGYEERFASLPRVDVDGTPKSVEALPGDCGFQSGAPSLSHTEQEHIPCSPREQGKSKRGFPWQEPPLDFESEVHGEQSKKLQMDRLDINVQIDDSYLVEKRWQCRLCEKSYTSKYNLVTHILGHNGIKPHSCPHCNKLFKQPSHLQTHLLTHQGTRPHKCEVCHKAFTQTSHLKRHMLLHSDIKPYSCRFCGRGFAYPSELKSHEGKHQSGRCHVCVECGLDFSTLTQLKRHLATHQGPTLYPCPECNKSFHYRSQLQNHLLKHQNVRPFVCTECGMEFSQIHHLKQHLLTHKVRQTQSAVGLEEGVGGYFSLSIDSSPCPSRTPFANTKGTGRLWDLHCLSLAWSVSLKRISALLGLCLPEWAGAGYRGETAPISPLPAGMPPNALLARETAEEGRKGLLLAELRSVPEPPLPFSGRERVQV